MAEREVIRCACGLNQFLTADGLCRKPDCRKRLRGEYDVTVATSPNFVLHAEEFYRPEVPFSVADPITEAEKAIDTLKIFFTSQSESNVRHKPRGRLKTSSGLTINNFPDYLRMAAIKYAGEHGMTLREVVIKAMENMVDTK